MSELHSIVGNTLDYSLTWCEHQRVEPYFCDWRIDPCLVIVIYPPQEIHRLLVRSGGEIETLEGSGGDALIVPAGVQHKFECPASEIIGVNIQYTLFEGVDILSFYQVPYHVESSRAKGLVKAIDSLVELIGQPSWYAGVTDYHGEQLDLSQIVRERQIVFELLATVQGLSELKPHGEKRLLLLQRLQPALEYIEANLEEKVSIDTLADICSLSGHRFSALFKEILGERPHQYILKRRIERAMSLLSHTEYPVTEISSRLGFHDQPHFTKLFQQVTGLSPTYYRKDIWRRFAKKSKP